MDTRIQKAVLAGISGTVIMTIITLLAPMMGMPKMSPPAMLSGMLGMPMLVGWIMHFMIGIMFALAYTYLCNSRVRIQNIWLRGAVFGFMVFIFAQIMMAMMGMMTPMPDMDGSMLMGSLMGHIIYGMTVAQVVGSTYCSDKSLGMKSA